MNEKKSSMVGKAWGSGDRLTHFEYQPDCPLAIYHGQLT